MLARLKSLFAFASRQQKANASARDEALREQWSPSFSHCLISAFRGAVKAEIAGHAAASHRVPVIRDGRKAIVEQSDPKR